MSFKGRIFTEEHKLKLSLAKLGKPSGRKGKTYEELYGEEKALVLRKKFSKDRKGRKAKKETIEKMRRRIPWNKGIKCPELSGKNHHNWKGGITTENSKLRNSIEYKAWRFDVFRRDWFTCQMPGCGYKGKDIEAHHIKKFNDYKELMLDKKNGITLCKKCHLLTRNKEEDFEELFIEIIRIKQ